MKKEKRRQYKWFGILLMLVTAFLVVGIYAWMIHRVINVPEQTDSALAQVQTETTAAQEQTESGKTEKDSSSGDAQTHTETDEDSSLADEAQQPEFPYYIKVNRQENCVTVYTLDENGEYTVPCRAMVCSTGKNNRTPLGTFEISDKYEWQLMFGGCYTQYASRIAKHILFHSVPYYTKDKGNLEYKLYNQLGSQASLGCIRLCVADAKWIYENCPSGTTVEIYDSDDPGPLGKPEPVYLDVESENRGWDPTDPDPENPWLTETEEEL